MVSISNNFLLNTDHPTDIVVYLNSGSFAVGGYPDSGTFPVPYTLPTTILVNMVWSTSPTFDVSYLSGSGPPPQDVLRNVPFGIEAEISANASGAIISYGNFTDPAITIYYRIYGFEPSNTSLDFPFTASAGDEFIFNTDYNYTKLYDAQIGNTVITNFGYLPQTELFSADGSGNIAPPNGGANALDQTGSFSPIGFMVTTSTVTYDSGGAPQTMHSRIYLDEAGVS